VIRNLDWDWGLAFWSVTSETFLDLNCEVLWLWTILNSFNLKKKLLACSPNNLQFFTDNIRKNANNGAAGNFDNFFEYKSSSIISLFCDCRLKFEQKIAGLLSVENCSWLCVHYSFTLFGPVYSFPPIISLLFFVQI
jgi:hypothetical protein